MRILPIIQQLKDNVALLEGRVEQARSLTALPDDEVKNGIPVAFVYSSSDGSEGRMSFDDAGQKVDVEFTVMIASDAINVDAGTESMEDVRDQIKSALIGFKVDLTASEIEFVSGSVLNTSSRMVWWADNYSLSIIT